MDFSEEVHPDFCLPLGGFCFPKSKSKTFYRKVIGEVGKAELAV
jgi:hypothetical protein